MSSAVVLTPFLMIAAIAAHLGEDEQQLQDMGDEQPPFKTEEVIDMEMGKELGNLAMFYAWSFHIPFIIWSEIEFAEETFILRYYPEDYHWGLPGFDKREVEAVLGSKRQSEVFWDENAGFFYYLAFPSEQLFSLEEGLSPVSFNEETTELTGKLVLVAITEKGEEVIFPFDLSKMR